MTTKTQLRAMKEMAQDASFELHRLRAENAELVAALNRIANGHLRTALGLTELARAALAKAGKP